MRFATVTADVVDRRERDLKEQHDDVLHQIFEEQVDARPSAIAVVQGTDTTTYRVLEHRANQLAHYLRRQGAGRGALVGMLLPRTTDAYAAILGILKAGAAYVPIDPEYPPERVGYILENARVSALVTSAELKPLYKRFRGTVVRTDIDANAISVEKTVRPRRRDVGLASEDLCYVIYTSGSTGRPKGVMISHRSACHLVRTEEIVYGVRSSDRVYQGASLAFDLSVEEMWLAFDVGATLVAAPPEATHAGPDLAHWLTQHGVTVLSSVPTLLSMVSDDVPTIRIVIFGGERCPEELVARWARPGRRLFNTYGPTETTVIATYAHVSPGKRVTIGRPLPGYRVRIYDELLRPVPHGEVGEICIGGIGVARGYVGLPAETRERFVADPMARPGERDDRMYLTGDLGRINDEGELEYFGRTDDQVKVRGYRVELSEIESVLLQHEGVRAAACAVREIVPGVQQLVGYVVHPEARPLHEEHVRAFLQSRLPAYMVPQLIEPIAVLPGLPSGKVDRAALPAPRERDGPDQSGERLDRARSQTERRLAEIWKALFHPQPVSIHDDFFLDLGGHSLLAARMVSELRRHARFASVSVIDVYNNPTIASLASVLDGQSHSLTVPSADHGASAPSPPRRSSEDESPAPLTRRTPDARERGRHLVVGGVQAASVWFALSVKGLPWVTPYLTYFILLTDGHSMLDSAAWAAGAAVAVFPVMLIVAISTKWLVLGRVRPGRHPLWSAYYLRWWFVHTVMDAAGLEHLSGTPLLAWAYRLLGARIGCDVYLATDRVAAFDVISIGDGSSIDERAALLGYVVEDGELVIGPVAVGRDAFVGTRTVLREETVIEDGGRLDDLSMLPRGSRIPRGETWAGSPARHVSRSDPPPPARPDYGSARRKATAVLYAALILLVPVVELIPFIPGIAILTTLDFFHPSFFLALPVVGAAFVLLFTTEVVVLKWLLVGRVRPGTYPVHGSFYIRNWVVDHLLAVSVEVAGQLRATLYVSPWYRALGARLGRFVELSTASSTTPDLLELEEGSTVADEVSLGTPRIEGGWMTVAPTHLGRRAFVGNSAVIPTGTTLGNRSLLGVLSIAPSERSKAAASDTAWLGSPPILLPRRQQSAAFSEDRTYRPTRRLRCGRGCFELLRVTLPPAGSVFVTASVINGALLLWEYFNLAAVLLLLPVVYTANCFGVLAAVAVVKWVVVGRYRPFERPLWCLFVWRLEFVNALYEFLATPLALEALQGTPMLPWYLRLLGARIGRRTYIETTGFLEWDLVEIGDRAALNEDCIMQTHLFEDRVLKASQLRVGAECEVGADSVVLYDSEMQDGSRLDAVSLLMKGERLPRETDWAGVPAASRNTTRVARAPIVCGCQPDAIASAV